MPRQFIAEDGVRRDVPLLLGLTAPSGGGKTWTSILLALGIQEIAGGDIYIIDSDNGRALHYAGMKTASGKTIKFKHIPFSAPHDSLSYRDALRYCESQKAGVIIVDTLSKEHDGEGGMLEAHEKEMDRLTKGNDSKRESMSMLAWAKPKAARRKLIQAIQELDTHTIFTFRAKQGVKPVKVNDKTEVVQQGFTPIAGDEFVFEMTLNALLLPNSKGVASWDSEYVGERQMIKLPEQFAGLRERKVPMDEKLGRGFAEWAKGGAARAPKPERAPEEEDERLVVDEADEEEIDDDTAARDAEDGVAEATMQSAGEREREEEQRPTETASAPSAEAGQDTSDSAAAASAASAEGTPGTTDEAPQGSATTSSAVPEEFTAFAFTCADAKTWDPIRSALPGLKKSEAWKAAPVEMQDRMHTIAFTRLMELIHEGYRFDFTEDLHAYRCYLAWEQDAITLKAHRDLVHKSRAWIDLPTDAKIVFDKAYDAAVARIEGAAAYA